MTQKQSYFAPEAEKLVVKYEQNIMSYGEPGNPGFAGDDDTLLDFDDLELF